MAARDTIYEAAAAETGYGTATEVEAETKTDPPALSHWWNVLELIREAFREVLLVEEYMWQVVVSILKVVGGGGLPRNWPGGGDVEGGDVRFQSLSHQIHFLTRCLQWFLGGLQHQYGLT